MKTGARAGRPVSDSGSWRAVAQRWFQVAYRACDLAAQRVSAAFDPRSRLLRQRRRALRWGLVFAAGCVFWVSVTALLASWNTPVWALLIPGPLAVGAVIPATLLLLRYRWLRSVPLPPQPPGADRRLPPPGSAARSTMSALGTSERGLFSLLGVMERGNMLPADELRDLTAAARSTSAAMTATAAEVVSMEQTVADTADARPYLAPTINALTAQLNTGVRQYNEMVTAAAQLVASANDGSGRAALSRLWQRHRDELTGATDRLRGWSYAFEELGRLA